MTATRWAVQPDGRVFYQAGRGRTVELSRDEFAAISRHNGRAFSLCLLGAFALVVGDGFWWSGTLSTGQAATAAPLCLLPAILAVLWARRMNRQILESASPSPGTAALESTLLARFGHLIGRMAARSTVFLVTLTVGFAIAAAMCTAVLWEVVSGEHIAFGRHLRLPVGLLAPLLMSVATTAVACLNLAALVAKSRSPR